MNEHYIGIVIDEIVTGALLKATSVGMLHFWREGALLALQQIMQTLRTFEVLLASLDSLPLSLYAQSVQ